MTTEVPDTGPWMCEQWVERAQWDAKYPEPVRCPAIRWSRDETCHNVAMHLAQQEER